MQKTCPVIGLSAAVIMVLMVAPPARAGEDDGFRPIFDGRTLEGWDGDPALWRVEEGAITGEVTADNPLKYNSFLIWRAGEVDDFELKFEYRIPSGNSGMQYRSFEAEEVGKWSVGGYQADFEAGDNWSGILYGEQYRGILADRGQKTIIGEDHKPRVVEQFADKDELGRHIRKGEWNEYHIIARGHHSILKINGQVMVDVADEDAELRRRSGIIAVQLHTGPPMKVQVRNVRLKRLPMEDKKKIVLVAGKPSHGYGAHEHNAGCLLLARELNEHAPGVHAVVYRDGWPADPTAFDNADAVVLYSDGGAGHMVVPHLDAFARVMERGVGLACIHYAVEVEKGKPGDRFLDWIGGYFEIHWSVNPHWVAQFDSLPRHPVTRGVRPFALNDEWYYHMRFREGMEGVTPLLTAVPPAHTLDRPDGAHSGNPHVRETKGQPQHVAWVFERPDSAAPVREESDRAATVRERSRPGRGFATTGGHWHWSWGHDDFRRLVLNALVWTAGADVPAGGVPTGTLSLEDLEANQDFPPPQNFNRDEIQQRLKEWAASAAP